MGHRLRANFLTGLIVVVPVVVTLYLTWAFITFVDGQVLPLVPAPYNPRTYIDADIPGYGLIVFLIFTTVVGYFAKKVFGKQLIRLGEDFVDRMPIVRSIYNALKQLVETVLSQSKTSFRQACLIEYPRRGLWAIAFISTDTKGEILKRSNSGEMVSVFLPTTPNPTSGFLLFVPKSDVVLLDMTIEEAAKLIISAGLVSPPSHEEVAAEQARIARRKEQLARVAGADMSNDKKS
ncbi:DUF502 domain-containing protein [Thermohalobaculum xanthum]|nr:DUF502 domain-containing protein [Thermohalobaculum xanthum]